MRWRPGTLLRLPAPEPLRVSYAPPPAPPAPRHTTITLADPLLAWLRLGELRPGLTIETLTTDGRRTFSRLVSCDYGRGELVVGPGLERVK